MSLRERLASGGFAVTAEISPPRGAGTGYIGAGPAALAKAANVPIVQLTENVPISDANSVAIREVNDAGPNGAVVLNFTPPEALIILQAAQKLGLENRVKLWGCSTPRNTDFLAQSLGPKWNNKLFVNADYTVTPDNGKLIASGPTATVLRDDDVIRAYLGVDQ